MWAHKPFPVGVVPSGWLPQLREVNDLPKVMDSVKQYGRIKQKSPEQGNKKLCMYPVATRQVKKICRIVCWAGDTGGVLSARRAPDGCTNSAPGPSIFLSKHSRLKQSHQLYPKGVFTDSGTGGGGGHWKFKVLYQPLRVRISEEPHQPVSVLQARAGTSRKFSFHGSKGRSF